MKKSANNHNKNNYNKNVEQFINKPSEPRKNTNSNISSLLMTPISNKTSIGTRKNTKVLSKLNQNDIISSKKSLLHYNNNNNDTLSLASSSRIGIIKKVRRGRSMSIMKSNANQSNLRLPNKSIIKNQEKVMIELQKLFGEKIQLNEEIYQSLTDLDRSNQPQHSLKPKLNIEQGPNSLQFCEG